MHTPERNSVQHEMILVEKTRKRRAIEKIIKL
jgi:hypothetical protein